jgi:hypothetical protein
MPVYTQGEDSGIVWGVAVYLECYARASADAMAERVFALARGDVFRQAG